MDGLELPECETLQLRRDGWRLHVTLDRPQVRNAMNARLVDELLAVFEVIAEKREIRAVVLRGAAGNFCAGGDIKEMAGARAQGPGDDGIDPLHRMNRRFGTLIETIDRAPQAVIALVEGAVMGGGFGLACVADVTITDAHASFRLPETSLGIPPAQIAPFVVRRIGLTNARRLAVTGGRFDGRRAVEIGIAHDVAEDEAALAQKLDATLAEIGRCAPQAIATTKALMLGVGQQPIPELLDRGAKAFAEAARGPEGHEGMRAFLSKAPPRWASE